MLLQNTSVFLTQGMINMKKIKVLYDFVLFTIAEKLGFYNNVLDKLTGNPFFTAPYISLTDVKAKLDAFEAAILAASDGAHSAISDRDDKELACDHDYRILASYVEHQADGNETQILSSGFHATKQPVQQQKATLEVVNGEHPGSVKFIAKAEDKAAAYIWQYILATALTADGVWQVASVTSGASATLDGLTSGSLYYFRVAYVTPAGTSEFCQPVSLMVA
jgi:hypothetical protein